MKIARSRIVYISELLCKEDKNKTMLLLLAFSRRMNGMKTQENSKTDHLWHREEDEYVCGRVRIQMFHRIFLILLFFNLVNILPF